MKQAIVYAHTYIETQSALDAVCKKLEAADRIAVDTEADSLHNYQEKVCLMQLSTKKRNVIIDPLVGLDLSALLALLAKKELIFHASDYDLRMLRTSYDFSPKVTPFDTMLAAQLLGYEKVGLAAIVEKECGVTLSKASQKTDWSKRPLSQKQIEYAVNDTCHLLVITEIMHAALKRLGRLAWHEESCRKIVHNTRTYEQKDQEDAWRARGTKDLSPKQLLFVRALWRWRDEEARLADKPTFKVISSQDIRALALTTAASPKSYPVFPKGVKGKRLDRIKKAIDHARALPKEEWPERLKKTPYRKQTPRVKEIAAALKGRDQIAHDLGISPQVIAARAAMEAMVHGSAQSVKDIMKCASLMKWQAELLRPVMKAMVFDTNV